MIASTRVDQTPLTVTGAYGSPRRLFTPLAALRKVAPDQTLFVAADKVPRPSKISGAALTPVGEEFGTPEPHPIAAPFGNRRDDVAVARDRRLELLVSQFDRGTSIEDDARLLILTQRLRRLVPSVPDGAWDVLAATTSTLEDVSRNLDSIKAKFDLR